MGFGSYDESEQQDQDVDTDDLVGRLHEMKETREDE